MTTRKKPARFTETCRLCGFVGTRGILFGECRSRAACKRRQAQRVKA